MRHILLASCVLFGSVTTSGLPADEFSAYDAVVDTDEAYVRSGPGESYYPTSRLRRGDAVQVHRHDPGGWYMISPPSGSFSWVPARYIRRGSGDTGQVTDDYIVAYVGSDFGDECSVFQRRLTLGEQVTILGEKTISTDRGPEHMYRIRPPRREWRWIRGNTLVRDTESLASRRTQSVTSGLGSAGDTRAPGANGLLFGGRSPSENFGGSRPKSRQVTNQTRSLADREKPSAREQLEADRSRLDQLDARFKVMIQSEMKDWAFENLEAGYRELQGNVAHPAMASQIDLRLAAIARYQRIKSEFDEFIELTNGTSRRDAELLGMTRSATGAELTTSVEPVPTPPGAAPRSTTVDTPPLGGQPSSAAPDLAHGDVESDKPAKVVNGRTRFVGAGMVQKSAAVPGVPDFVLLTPQGRILAYLEPESGSEVDLNQHVGKAMGLEGERQYNEKLGTDLINVRKLVPVRLTNR